MFDSLHLLINIASILILQVYKLNEKLAVEYGSEFISEFFLYAFGTAVLLFEYNRSSRKVYIDILTIER